MWLQCPKHKTIKTIKCQKHVLHLQLFLDQSKLKTKCLCAWKSHHFWVSSGTMAPKNMKTMKKKHDLEKSPKKKGLENSPKKKGLEKPSNQRGLEKSSGRKGLEKPMKKPGCNDGGGLEKQGTIKDKVKAAAEETEGDADQGAAILHGSLSKLDKSKLWAKQQASLRGNKALEKAHAQLGKTEKGITACKWLLEKEGKQFLQASRRVSVGEVVTKTDNWETDLQMLTRYTPEELEMHLQSGKVIWRECPYTSGTFEYKDTQNWHKAINTARQKEWQRMRTWSSSALTAIPCLWMKSLEKVVPRALEKARGPLEKAEEAGAEPSRRRMTRMSLIPMRSLPRLAGLPGIWCLQQCQTWKKLWKKQVPS